MLRKKESYISITPIPSSVPRQLALDILHSHGEIITLNPLVLSYHPITAPRDAAADEYYSTWYEIIERVQYLPGLGKLGAGKISFKGCFHNTPWGLQTHTFVPLGIDIRSKWRIAGNQPNEPRQPKEFLVDGEPENGLYLREDIQIECNLTLISFVKSQMKAASKVLVERLMKKAELLDAGVLEAFMEDGKLKTINPANRSNLFQPSSPLQSPRLETDAMSESSSNRSGAQSLTEHPRWGSTSRRRRQSSQLSSQSGKEKKDFVAELPGNYYHPQSQNESTNQTHYELPDQPVNPGPLSPKPKGGRHYRHFSRDGGSATNNEVHNTIHEMGNG